MHDFNAGPIRSCNLRLAKLLAAYRVLSRLFAINPRKFLVLQLLFVPDQFLLNSINFFQIALPAPVRLTKPVNGCGLLRQRERLSDRLSCAV